MVIGERAVFVLMLFFLLAIATVACAQYNYIPLSIEMRDGKFLAADLYTVDTLTPKPTILIQTPYNKFWYRYNMGNANWQIPFDSLSYNYLVVDWRGFYGSAGADSLGYDRGLDGYDLVEYIASEPWSNGKVGTWGASALGVIQFMTARHQPPHLSCCVPMVADSKTSYTDYYYGGDYLKELTQMRAQLGFLPESLILAHYTYDVYWWLAEMLTSYPESISVPVLLITGWYDHNLDAPLAAYYALRDSSEPSVREKHKLLIGPWTHSGLGRLEQGELTYPGAVDSVRMPSFRIFDYYLRSVNNGYESEPKIRFFLPGSETWASTDDWFSYSNHVDTFFLREGGVLSRDPPGNAHPPDSFFYDPHDPAPSIGGNRFNPFNPGVVVGPRDQRDSVEIRSDVLIYTTAVFGETLTIAGDMQVNLSVSSDCADTDFGVRVTDVYPDGRSMLITEGMRRMRFRNSYTQQELMVPGDTYSVFIELRDMAYTFAPGHRLRLIVSSSDYPIFDINLNNGDSLYVPGDTVIALNRVYHEPGARSFLLCETREPACINEVERSCCADIDYACRVCGGDYALKFCLAQPSAVDLNIYTISGRKVTSLMSRSMSSGTHTITFDMTEIPQGIYFVMLEINGRRKAVIKLISIFK